VEAKEGGVTTRMLALTEKITTEFGAIHTSVSVDENGLARVAIDHNDRLTDSAVGKLIAQIVHSFNSMLDDAR